MIKLLEILHSIRNENKEGLVELDKWNILHAEYLESMDFKADGMYHYSLHKPNLKVSYKRGEGFIVEDKTQNQKHVFKNFKKMENFFDSYKQKWEDAPHTNSPEDEEEENTAVK